MTASRCMPMVAIPADRYHPHAMFYMLSKVGFFLVQPSTVAVTLLIVAIAGNLLRPVWRVWRPIGLAGLASLLLFGFSPLANLVILPLEQRFAKPDLAVLAGDIAAIVVLGGFEEGRVSDQRGELGLNEAAERLTETRRLAGLLPATKVVFTGGAGGLVLTDRAAAAEVADWLAAAGVARERLVLEDRSRNTWENATLTRDLVRPEPGQRFLLVTSAHHMPRSIGVFRQAGFDVIAYPVDYRTSGWGDALRPFASLGDGLRRLDVATKEWVGLLAYYLTGRSSALLPAP